MILFISVAVFSVCVAIWCVLRPLWSTSKEPVASVPAHLIVKTRPPVFIGLCLLILMPLGVWGCYHHWGAWAALEKHLFWQDHQALLVQWEKRMDSDPQSVIDELHQRVDAHPTDPRGWFLLGRLYMSQSQYQLAERAFARSYSLKPSGGVAVFMMQSQLLTQHPLTTVQRSLVRGLFKASPREPVYLDILALDAYRREAWEQSLSYWQQLLVFLDPTSAQATRVRALVAQLEKQLSTAS